MVKSELKKLVEDSLHLDRKSIKLLQNGLSEKERKTFNSIRYRLRYPDRIRKLKKKIQREYSLKTKFGITVKEYEDLLKKQNNCCAICLKVPVGEDTYRLGKSLAVDHSHKTGKVRGLLCDLCNRALGQFQDDIQILNRAVIYLSTTL